MLHYNIAWIDRDRPLPAIGEHCVNWVRSKLRQAATLALFALAIQLVLSFGHVHADDFAHASTLTTQATASRHDTTPQSPLQHHDGLAAHHCGVCASIVHAGALVAAATPSLPVPPAFAIRTETAAADFTLPDLTRAAFRSRAPPLS